MKIARVCLLAIMTLELCVSSQATSTVHDPIHTVLNVAQQVYGQVKQELQHNEDVSKFTTMIEKQIQQINQLTNIINKDVEQLRRFGDPNTYVNMLGLDELLKEANQMESGVGKTIEEFRQSADGLAALKNTGKGLYEDFNNQLSGSNESIGRLENEVASTARQINSAGSLVETEKLKGKLQAVGGMTNTSIQRATLAALKILVQGESNRNDQARAQEAVRQRKAQEMQTENQQLYALGRNLLGPSRAP